MERLAFDPNAFNDSFFAELEQDIDFDKQASQALKGILTTVDTNGNRRTYEQIAEETKTFFDNPWVQESEALMNRLAVEAAHFCNGHEDSMQSFQDNKLESVVDRGNSLIDDKQKTENGAVKRSEKKDKKNKKKDKKKQQKKSQPKKAKKAAATMLRLF